MRLSFLWLLAFAAIAIFIIFFPTKSVKKKIWHYWREFQNTTNLLPVGYANISTNDTLLNIIFLHHSVGENLIIQGNVRDKMTLLGYSFWDHGYNSQGLTNPKGEKLGFCYDIPSNKNGRRGNGNTDPVGLSLLFQQPVHFPPNDALSRILLHDVIIFKSCYPNSAIKSDKMLHQYKQWFLGIRNVIDKYPNKLFIAFTLPPLHPLATNREEANRARRWANWLKSSAFLDGHSNIFIFDFFNLLADSSSNMLRPEYQRNQNNSDSHPNATANRIIGPIFVDFVNTSIKKYKEKIKFE